MREARWNRRMVVWVRASRRVALAALAVLIVPLGMLVGVNSAAALGTSTKMATGTSDLYAVTCSTTSSCVAVGTVGIYPNAKGVVVAIVNGVPGTPHTVSGTGALYDVACTSASACVAVGEKTNNGGQGVVVKITSSIPGSAQYVTGTTELNRVACEPSRVTCVATGFGTKGAVVPIVAGSAGAAALVSGTGYLGGVTCPSATSCIAAGQSSTTLPSLGLVLPIASGVPGTPKDVTNTADLGDIACPSATHCEAVGAKLSGTGIYLGAAAVSVTSSVPGAAKIVTSLNTFNGVACGGLSTCEATGGVFSPTSTSITTITNGIPGTPQHAPSYLGEGLGPHPVACPSSTRCVVIGFSGATPVGRVIPISSGIVGGAHAVVGASYLVDVTCPTTSLCLAVGLVRGTTQTGVVTKITLP